MVSGAVELPRIQNRGRFWGMPSDRLQGLILFCCLGVVQLEETSGSRILPCSNHPPGRMVDSAGCCFCSGVVALVLLLHSCLQGGVDRQSGVC